MKWLIALTTFVINQDIYKLNFIPLSYYNKNHEYKKIIAKPCC